MSGIISSMLPVIGVAFETNLLLNVQKNIQDNMEKSMNRHHTKISIPKPQTSPKIQVARPRHEIINWWDTDGIAEHYKKIKNMYGLPSDW